jgi:hypothetical protein
MRTEQAIINYGREVCLEAYDLHVQGNGAGTIGFYLNLTTRQADCAIDAGRDIFHQEQTDDEIEQANLLNELKHNS